MGSAGAALVAGALAAFNLHLLTRLPHVQAAHAWGLPLTLYFADRLMERPRRSDAVFLALVVAATAATSIHSVAFCGLIIAVVVVTGIVRWRSVVAIVAASVLGLLVAVPVLWPYIRLVSTGATRPLSTVAQFSATPAAYLTSLAHLHAGWTARFFQNDVNVLFAGITALVPAAIGMASAFSLRADRRRIVMLVVLAAAGVYPSFGPATALYPWLYAWVPPLRGLRAVVRFGYL